MDISCTSLTRAAQERRFAQIHALRAKSKLEQLQDRLKVCPRLKHNALFMCDLDIAFMRVRSMAEMAAWHAQKFFELQEKLQDRLQEKYNPDQPRVPAGNEDGGQWTDMYGAASAVGSHSGGGRDTPQTARVRVADSGVIASDADSSGTLSSVYREEVPLHIPPNADIHQNMSKASENYLNFWWFYNQVRNKGPWDYKQLDKAKYESFGNFHYGAVGRSAGFPEAVLLRAAGWAHVSAGNRGGSGTPPTLAEALLGIGGIAPFGDDPVDQLWIKRGFKYYDATRDSLLYE